jgi:hypothetical protein
MMGQCIFSRPTLLSRGDVDGMELGWGFVVPFTSTSETTKSGFSQQFVVDLGVRPRIRRRGRIQKGMPMRAFPRCCALNGGGYSASL